ncbi:hypothetical protein JRQ81_019075 [Phrynocephalus forsythii]|uniref:BCLAF1 and THRAP3 family member 3 n=1 Tax=Phrynocephalus forsythii TaxID=171643 RepID=A0A9Q0XPH3_9SAUR|nr:hypothetical protein JRQ81_019075 [Phrynocephalus forsythii]
MVRSRSRSPRWKRRCLSPAARSQENNRQRHNHINYDSEYRVFQQDPKRPVPWRTEDGKYGQANSRYLPHETNHHQLYEYRSYSPTLKRIPSEDIYSHKSCRTHSPERNENFRGCQFASRYSEMSHKEHNQSFYPSETRVREMHEDNRSVGNTKGMKTFHRPLETSFKLERKWNDTDLRHHLLQEDKFTHSPRRFSNEFIPRSSFEKRYREDRDYREHGHSYKRAKEAERYHDREISSHSKWKYDHSSKPNHEKEEQRNLGPQTHQPVEKEHTDSFQTKLAFDYKHKHHRHPAGGKYISGERAEKYMKLEDPKYNCPRGSWESKDSEHYSREKESHTEEPRTEAALKYASGKGSNSFSKTYKSSADQKEKERIKKHDGFRGRVDISSNRQHGTSNKISDVKVSDVYARKEKLTVKVDMKKTVNKYRSSSSHVMERQTSRDLVAVGRKTGSFHSVFEHIKSVTQNVEQNPSKEFAQEIITIIHQIKANCFKSSDITLHERFSKIQDNPIASEVKRNSDPEIHRRIDMSLADLQNRRAISCESGQSVVRVLEDPNDLRHDIERRRKERLQNEDEPAFYADDISQRHEQSCNFPNLQNSQMHGIQKYSRFLNRPFRRFIKKPYTNYYTARPYHHIAHYRFKGHHEASQRPFKPNFTDGRSHFRSNLLQKGLYIQAKYQRLRYAGARGFSTNRMRRGFFRKEQVNDFPNHKLNTHHCPAKCPRQKLRY